MRRRIFLRLRSQRRDATKKPRRLPGLLAGYAWLLQRAEPVVHVLAGLILGIAITLLQLAFELLAAALDDVEIVVGELAPLLLGGALELLPVAFHAVPIHRCPPVWSCDGGPTEAKPHRSRRNHPATSSHPAPR